jgi:ParB family chromosome partitioning protein
MAKRRKLTAPTAEDLAELEQGFAAKPSAASAVAMMPPIAQVAAEAAALTPMVTPEMRTEAARDKRDAERLRQAEAEGLVMLDIAAEQIVAEELTRDRMELDAEAMGELKASIRLSGLRLPIEVFELVDAPPEGPRYGLLSGFRRLAAVKALAQEDGTGPAHIRAILREPGSVAGAYLHMVEENEIRADLSPYERGRVAVQAVAHGAYDSVEQAVNGLFHAASKAKRSKIRSFALIHEELGDMLSFALSLSERNGLRLAGALRAGFAGPLREALANGQGLDADLEWALMEPLVAESEQALKSPSRGGRPKRGAVRSDGGPGVYDLGNGIVLRRDRDSKGYYIRIQGNHVDLDMVDTVLFEIRRLLEPG